MVVSAFPNMEDILHFSFPGLLPEEQTVVLNTVAGSLSLLTFYEGRAYELYHVPVSHAEMPLLIAIFQASPYYASYEVVHAASLYGHTSDARVERSREELEEASKAGLWDHAMRPVRNVLSRGRAKIRPCGLDIVSILETGYILRAYAPRGGV